MACIEVSVLSMRAINLEHTHKIGLEGSKSSLCRSGLYRLSFGLLVGLSMVSQDFLSFKFHYFQAPIRALALS